MRRVLLLLLALGVGLPAAAKWAMADKAKGDTPAETATKSTEETDAQRRHRLRMQRNDRILTRTEIEAAMAPHVPGIAECYKRSTANQPQANGRLSLEMLIRPEGTLQSLWVRTPSVRGDNVARCVTKLSKNWQFPEKPGFTNAVVPFYFQKTNVKGVGPLRSCWQAKGCPQQVRSEPKPGKKL